MIKITYYVGMNDKSTLNQESILVEITKPETMFL